MEGVCVCVCVALFLKVKILWTCQVLQLLTWAENHASSMSRYGLLSSEGFERIEKSLCTKYAASVSSSCRMQDRGKPAWHGPTHLSGLRYCASRPAML